ncbi:WD40 repeat domain-containing protein [Streptomyces sp. NBC_00335]|uniref:WD40 repeat domain-containing protein n=1 Tax=unclassified Streptomyces TaxID=2593676 RepID=UPI00225A1F45|nr:MULTISPECIES: WD40 repeat domain-containing protein [unclassified Streptomyces]MCX5409746.1 WD40 repeat domain-containing protein [Streptomyces sp. NBC_00086]
MTRALVAGAGDFPVGRRSEADRADGAARSLQPLPSVAPALRELSWALHRAGVDTGEPLLEPGRSRLRKRWKKLRRDGEAEAFVLYFAGHGVRGAGGGLYLACSGADPQRLDDTCVSVGRLLEEVENRDTPVLFLLDVCGAGQAIVQQQLQDLAARRPQDGVRNAWIIGASSAGSAAYGAHFTSAAGAVLHRLADGTLDLDPALAFVPVDTLAAAIDRELSRAALAAGRPAQAVVRTPHAEARVDPEPFLRNPAHSTDPGARVLDGLDPRLREFAHACSPGLDPLHFLTRAAGNPVADAVQFSGRTAELTRIHQWVEDEAQNPLLVVTGGPGSGKSALLGVTVCLTHPQLSKLGPRVRAAVRTFRPRPTGRVLAVHARGLSLGQITDSLLHQLRRPSSRPARAVPVGERPVMPHVLPTADVLSELRAAGDVLVVLDGLDEAADPAAVIDELVLPLVRGNPGRQAPSTTKVPGVRVLLGTRPWWDALPELHAYATDHPETLLDLDPVTEEDRRVLADDLDSYLDLLIGDLYQPALIRGFAERLAQYTDGGAFLVAALYADHLRSGPESDTIDPPCGITEVFELHRRTLARTDPWIEPVLAVLVQARGQGMPLDLLHTAALAHSPPAPGTPTPQLAATRRALASATFYLRTTPDTDHRLLYRYFHQALADHTAPTVRADAVHAALLATVPPTLEGGPDWERADPYLLRHAAEHAVAAGDDALDRLVEDPLFLAHAEPDALTLQLRHTTGERAVAHADVYRAGTAHHPQRHRLGTRRALLALNAVRYGVEGLRRRLSGSSDEGDWEPLWATGGSLSPALSRTLTGHTAPVDAVAVTDVAGRPVVVSASRDLTARVWDMATGRPVGAPLVHDDEVYAVACTRLGGVPVAVTGTGSKRSKQSSLWVWDLHTGRLTAGPLAGHFNFVFAIACGELDGDPVAVSASRDGTLLRWDLTAGRTIGEHLRGHSGPVMAVRCTMLDDRPVIVSGGNDGTVRVWDLASGSPVRAPLKTRAGDVVALACTRHADRPAVLTGHRGHGQDVLRLWDLDTGQAIGGPLLGHTRSVFAASVLPGDASLAVTGSADGTVRMWDLDSGHQKGATLTGHTGTVFSAAAGSVHGRPVITTGSSDADVRIWDLQDAVTARGHRTSRVVGHTGEITSVACAVVDGADVAVSASRDGTLRVWDLATGRQPVGPLVGHGDTVTSVVCATRHGRPVAVSGSLDGDVIVWDLSDGTVVDLLPTVDAQVRHVACASGPGPVIIALYADGVQRQWTLDTLSRTGPAEPWVLDEEGPGGGPAGPPDAFMNSPFIAHLTALRLAGHQVAEELPMWSGLVASTGEPGKTLLVTADSDGVLVWDAPSGRPRGKPLPVVPARTTALACALPAAGPPLAATLDRDGTVRIWDLGDRSLIGTMLVSGATAVALTGGPQLVAAVGTDLAVFTPAAAPNG